MFKYGGDVKRQGIMHGMNGLRDGGIATTMADATGYAGGGMANNQGPRRAALVGNPVYPKTNGREHHAFVFGAALPAIGAAALRYGRPLLQGAKRIFGKTTPASVTKGSKLTAAQAAKELG